MAQTLYINSDPQAGPPRATVLGCGWMAATPPQYAALVSSLPVVILSGAGTTIVISDNPPTTNAAVASALAPILTAETNAAAAQATLAANQTTINSRLASHRTQLLAFIVANPSGAVLTAGQTLILAQMLIDLTDADLGLLADTTGT